MLENFIIILISVSPVLWMISLFILSSWKHFWKFFIANALVVLIYLTLIIDSNLLNFGHDEYGLKGLLTIVSCIVIHVVLGLLFAIGYKLKSKGLH